MGKYFGTDGFRGEANVDLTVENAFKVGRYLGYYYGRNHKAKIVIGKDTRRSSYMFEYALVAGLTASGADAYLLHVTTTPSVSYIVRTDGFDAGIMISASHNPYYDNGIKVINGKGMKLEADIEKKIEEYIDGQDISMIYVEGIGPLGPCVVNCDSEFYDYEMKTIKDNTVDIKTLDGEYESLYKIVNLIANKLDIKGYAKIDFRKKDDKYYLIEVNAQVSFHPIGEFITCAKKNGYSFDDIIIFIAKNALKNEKKKNSIGYKVIDND